MIEEEEVDTTEYTFVSQSEDEDFEDHKPIRHVHVVSTNVFDNVQVFRYQTDALTYAFGFIETTGAAPALSYKLYRLAYMGTGMVIMRSANEKSDIAATVRKTELRRDRCYAKIRK